MIDRPKFAEFTYDWLDHHLGDHISTERYNSIEVKMDGIWGCMNIDSDGSYKIYSRTCKVKKEGHFKSEGKWPLSEIILLGEYMKGSAWANRRSLDGEFFVFDSLRGEDRDLAHLPLYERRVYRNNSVNAIIEHAIGEPSWINILPSHYISDFRSIWKRYVVDKGYEGLVLKDIHASYGDDKAWARVKAISEIEYMCIGFTEADPESRYAGQVGSVIGSLIDKPCKVKCGGLTDSQRKVYTDSPADYIGRVFKATGKGYFPSGSLRHPKFAGWRDDKRIDECTYDQIPEQNRED